MSSASRYAIPVAVAEARRVIDRAMTEKELHQLVADAAKVLGWRAYWTHNSRRSPAGFPDLVLAGHGRLLFLELKTERGRMEPDQIAWQETLLGCRQDHRVIRPSNVDALLADLKRWAGRSA